MVTKFETDEDDKTSIEDEALARRWQPPPTLSIAVDTQCPTIVPAYSSGTSCSTMTARTSWRIPTRQKDNLQNDFHGRYAF